LFVPVWRRVRITPPQPWESKAKKRGPSAWGYNRANPPLGDKYRDLFPQDWGLDRRLTTLLCVKKKSRNSKNGKPDQIWQNLLKGCFDNDDYFIASVTVHCH
jgi:hypothetical protein